jgi:hypothetical protein
MKIIAKTVLSGSTSFCILSGMFFSSLGLLLVGYGSLIIFQAVLQELKKNQAYS